jgi:DNA-binding response OmpR family regulator
MPAKREALTKLRILVAEDEILVAMLVEEMLQELGCEIVATVSSVAEATAAVRRNNLDAALLDCNLNGENSSPVADELLGHAVPFLLVTGYGGRTEDPPSMKTAPRLKKPFDIDELANRMLEIFVQHPTVYLRKS